MNAEEIAAAELSKYAGCVPPQAHAWLTRVIREAEGRGYDRGKAETVDGGPLDDFVQFIGSMLHGVPLPALRAELPTTSPAVEDMGMSAVGPCGCVGDIESYTVSFTANSAAQQGPAVRHDVPLFVYFQGDDGNGGAIDAQFRPSEEVAEQVAQEFVRLMPNGLGFTNASPLGLHVLMRNPHLAPQAINYIRRAVRDIVTSVTVERDVAWSVALAEAGLSAVPLTPEHVADVVEDFEDETVRERDGEWKEAFIAAVVGTVGPREPYIVPLDPTGLQQAISDHAKRIRRDILAHTNAKCEEAAKVARRRERDACFKIANGVARQLDQVAKSAGPLLGRRVTQQVHGAITVAEQIIKRDDQDVSTPDQAEPLPVAQSH